MNGIKLYIPIDDLNTYVRERVDETYKNHTFLPIKVEVNEHDFSIEICMVSTNPIAANGLRYKLDLEAMAKEPTNG